VITTSAADLSANGNSTKKRTFPPSPTAGKTEILTAKPANRRNIRNHGRQAATTHGLRGFEEEYRISARSFEATIVSDIRIPVRTQIGSFVQTPAIGDTAPRHVLRPRSNPLDSNSESICTVGTLGQQQLDFENNAAYLKATRSTVQETVPRRNVSLAMPVNDSSGALLSTL